MSRGRDFLEKRDLLLTYLFNEGAISPRASVEISVLQEVAGVSKEEISVICDSLLQAKFINVIGAPIEGTYEIRAVEFEPHSYSPLRYWLTEEGIAKANTILLNESERNVWESQLPSVSTNASVEFFVDLRRLQEIKAIKSKEFDLSRLIQICEEMNACYQYDCFLAVAMLTRALLDHVPPIFGHKTFVQVANNYGAKSFKNSMLHLQNSSRNIADAHLHIPIRRKEILPTTTQVNFSNDIDVLLAEVVRVLKP